MQRPCFGLGRSRLAETVLAADKKFVITYAVELAANPNTGAVNDDEDKRADRND